MLKEPELTLQKAVDIRRAHEVTPTQMKSFTTSTHDDLTDIHSVQKDKQLCDRSGNWHTRQQVYPAFGAECRRCGRKNHFAKMCHTKLQPLHGIHMDGNEESADNDMFIGALQKNSNTKEWQMTITINNQRTKFKIDKGAQCNVISKHTYFTVCKAPLQKSMAKLTAFGGHKLHTCGKAIIPCEYNGQPIHG